MAAQASLKGTGPTEFDVPELVKLAADGVLRIPSFQRAFVWDASDVRQLFDSLYRGFPIGAILLWRKEGPAGLVSFGPIQVEAPERADALWVIDGQQRVTSLFGALSPDWSGVDERFEVYLDLATGKFVNPRRRVPPSRSIPVRAALETRRLNNWLRGHGDDLEPADFDTADGLVGVIRDYRVPAYIVAADEQDLLRVVFDRVNSAGKPISRAQVFHALFASEMQPGSPAAVIKQLSALGFGNLDENRVVQTLLAIRGGDVQRDVHREFGDDEDPADWYDRTAVALSRAITFLKQERVPHIQLMPSTLPLPVLSVFFYIHPDPTPWVRRLLSLWLWRGWLHGFGRSGQTPELRRAVSSLNPKKLMIHEAPSEYPAVARLLGLVADSEPEPVPLHGFATDKANGRLILLALASLAPKRPNGSVIDVAAEYERSGSRSVTALVPGHRTNAASRGFWPFGFPLPTGSEDPAVLASHAITDASAAMLRSKDYDGFIRARGETLTALVHDFLSSRVEAGLPVRPPLAELLVPDPEGD